MRILILAQWNWHGPARLPCALKKAGAEVAAICKKGDLCCQSNHLDRKVYVDTSDERSIVDGLHATLTDWKPDLVLPGTDNMVATLQKYRGMVRRGTVKLSQEMAAILDQSLVSVDKEGFVLGKIDLLEEMARRGVPVAPQMEVSTLGDADRFVREHGYPVLLKPDKGFAGQGIRFCRDEPELLSALEDMVVRNPVRLAIQKHLGELTAQFEFVAKNGKIIAGNGVFRVKTYPEVIGVTSVARIVRGTEMRQACETMCEFLGYNGFGVAQFVVEDAGCERAHLIELNPRMSSFPHLWRLYGTDLADALVRAWSNERPKILPPKVDLTFALYPQEALRDRESEFLTGLRDRVDDEPEILASYNRLVEQHRPANS